MPVRPEGNHSLTTETNPEPKVCPSCDKDNPPAAISCSHCLTPFGGAIQTAPTPNLTIHANEPAHHQSTDITKATKSCPSCGHENTPTATCCARCLATFGGAIQTTPKPEPVTKRPVVEKEMSGCAVLGIIFLTFFSFIITFFAACAPFAFTSLSFGLSHNPSKEGMADMLFIMGWVVGLLAATFVAYLVVRAFSHHNRR